MIPSIANLIQELINCMTLEFIYLDHIYVKYFNFRVIIEQSVSDLLVFATDNMLIYTRIINQLYAIVKICPYTEYRTL